MRCSVRCSVQWRRWGRRGWGRWCGARVHAGLHYAPRTTHPAPRTTHHAPRTTHPAPRTPHPADELLLHYGNRSNFELQLRYGFSLGAANPDGPAIIAQPSGCQVRYTRTEALGVHREGFDCLVRFLGGDRAQAVQIVQANGRSLREALRAAPVGMLRERPFMYVYIYIYI